MLVLDDLRVPGNIGALLRTADAAGLDAVILVDSALDLYNPNIIRSSTGACFCDDIYVLSSDDAAEYFARRGFQLLAADAGGDASVYDVALRRPSALILGTEDRGLSDYWRGRCHQLIRVPSDRAADRLIERIRHRRHHHVRNAPAATSFLESA